MEQTIFLINTNLEDKATRILHENNIEFRIAGFPNGSAKVIENFPSKLDVHEEMTLFAKQLGYKDMMSAINKYGGRMFRMKFNKEFKRTIKTGVNV